MNQSYSPKAERDIVDKAKATKLEIENLMEELYEKGEPGVCNLGGFRLSAHIHPASDNDVWDYEVLKRKNNKATVIRLNGETYQLQHKNQFKGKRK